MQSFQLGIRELCDFIIIRHPATNHAITKVHKQCFEGTLKETPMKVAKGHLAMESAIPSRDNTNKETKLESYPVQRLHIYAKCILIRYLKKVILSYSMTYLCHMLHLRT